jgi:S1-C subfamily serine protease
MSNLLQQLNFEMAAVVSKVRHSLVQIRDGRGGAGAGTVWHPDGLVITNAHVVRGDISEIALADGRILQGRLIARDVENDLAALTLEGRNLPTIELGDSRTLRPGQWVLALGHPWGVVGAVSAGPVINVGLPPELPHLGREFVQAGLQLRPGHSGGPMVDVQGRLIGINTMITGPEVGLAVPLHVVKAFLRQHLGAKTPPQEDYI